MQEGEYSWLGCQHVIPRGQVSQSSQLTRNEKGCSGCDCNPPSSRGVLEQEHASLARPCVPADVCAQVRNGVGNQSEDLQHRVAIAASDFACLSRSAPQFEYVIVQS